MVAALLILILIVVLAQLFVSTVPVSPGGRVAVLVVGAVLVLCWIVLHLSAVLGVLR